MGLKGKVAHVAEQFAIGKRITAAVRLRRVQRDWSTVHRAKARKTTLSIFTNVGRGDMMIAKQCCETFVRYCETVGDPALGNIVITAGAWPLHFRMEKGDHNVYWWWSMNGQEDWLDLYLNNVEIKPDVVACLSFSCMKGAQALGCRTIHLPLAAGERFRPSCTLRNGIGYGGSKKHKDERQVEAITGPFKDDVNFEWVDNLKTPEDLNAFYNRKQIILGMTEAYQEKIGMVNNRVFEVLATGTPFILYRHRTLNETLGFEYPYQSDSYETTKRLADSILVNYSECLERFQQYSREIQTKHTYWHRLGELITFLKGKNG
jgi:hypothetical protein